MGDALQGIIDVFQDAQSTLEQRNLDQTMVRDTSRRRRFRPLSGKILIQYVLHRYKQVNRLIDEHTCDG
jgi:hypothetical protein